MHNITSSILWNLRFHKGNAKISKKSHLNTFNVKTEQFASTPNINKHEQQQGGEAQSSLQHIYSVWTFAH